MDQMMMRMFRKIKGTVKEAYMSALSLVTQICAFVCVERSLDPRVGGRILIRADVDSWHKTYFS
jgi:hypothetical protein